MLKSTLISNSNRAHDVQVAPLGNNTTIIRSRTWERLKFEVEYAQEKGTTANSYLIRAEANALIDPPGETFTSIFLSELQKQIPLPELDYVILNHVNPNRMVTLKALLENHSKLTVICSKPAAKALLKTFPEWKTQVKTVHSQDCLDLGGGHELQFITIPTPRWPDGLLTFDHGSKILYTDKLFGVHVCDEQIFDENWKLLDGDRRYYFHCLYSSQTKQIESTLKTIADFTAKYYAPGHGPVIRFSLSRLRWDYLQWCEAQKNKGLRVALLYASAYGNTAILADGIAMGLAEKGVAVESINCEFATAEEITHAVEIADGFIIGSPTLGGHAPTQIQTALGIILSTASKSKLAGVFGSYGWSGEAIDLIENKLRDSHYRFGFETIRVKFTPTEETLEICQQAGAQFAQMLKKCQKNRTPRQAVTEVTIDRTSQAVGRIVGSLCVLSTRRGETHHGFLTSWVSQATFNPPGLMLAVAKDQNAENLINPGAKFVLNILQEGRHIRKHFSYNIDLGKNPFTEVETFTASNGCLVINDALAYLECTVENYMETGERWLVYAVIDSGKVLQDNGVTAIAHRKSGSHYYN